MEGRFQPVFHGGDFVRERDSGICGHVRGPGEYPGEWRIVCADGTETACLGENLSLARAPARPDAAAPWRSDRG